MEEICYVFKIFIETLCGVKMTDPTKIWRKIQDAFIKIEVDDIAVKIIILPLKYLKIIQREPITLDNGGWSEFNSLCYVTNPCSKNNKIWGAKVTIGNRIKAKG